MLHESGKARFKESWLAFAPEAVAESIHAELAHADLLPRQHLVDSGDITASILVSSQREYGIDVISPARADVKWQARTKQGIDGSTVSDELAVPAGDLPRGTYQQQLDAGHH